MTVGWTGIPLNETQSIAGQVKAAFPEIMTIKQTRTAIAGRTRYDVWETSQGDLIHSVWIVEPENGALWIKVVPFDDAVEVIWTNPTQPLPDDLPDPS